jgi:hypothetical protein
MSKAEQTDKSFSFPLLKEMEDEVIDKNSLLVSEPWIHNRYRSTKPQHVRLGIIRKST